MLEELGEQTLMHHTSSGKPTAYVVGAAPVAFNPFIDRTVCRTGVECNQRPIAEPGRYVCHAAKV